VGAGEGGGGRAEGYFFLAPSAASAVVCVSGSVLMVLCVGRRLCWLMAVCALVRDGVRCLSRVRVGRRSAGCPVYLRQQGFFFCPHALGLFFAGLRAVVPLLPTRRAG
jgi:hypothetical protein